MGKFIFGMLNLIIKALAAALSLVVNLLPASPFQIFIVKINTIDNEFLNTVLGALNWLFPITEAIAVLEVWVLAIGVYYIYAVVLRWTKTI